MRPPTPFELLYREHIKRVLSLVRLCGIRDGYIDDVTQEVFLALHRALPGLDLTAKLGPWLGTVTCRAARDHLKRTRREQPTAEGELDPIDRRDDPEHTAMIAEAHRELSSVLDEMKPERRIVFVFHEIDETPMSLIAEALEIPIGTGYSRLRAAREDFEAIIARRRAQQRGALGLMPLFLMDPNVLLGLGKAPGKPDDAASDRIWERLVQAIGPALLAVPPKAGPTRGQLAASHGVSAIAGGGIGAVVAMLLAAQTPGAPISGDPVVRAAGAPTSSAPATLTAAGADSTVDAGVAAADAGRLDGGAAAMDPESAERFLIQSATAALHQAKPDPARALRALTRHAQQFPHGTWAPEREALEAEATAMLARDRAEDGGAK